MSLVPRPRHPSAQRTPSPTGGRASTPQAPERPTPEAPDSPIGTFPRRIPGHASDGWRWELLVDASGISAVMAGTTVGEAHIWTRDERVTIEFWVDGADFPHSLSAHLVEQAFTHPAVSERRPVLVCIPRRDAGLLDHVLRHVAEAHTHAAGMTCLIEGVVGIRPPAPLPAQRMRI